MYKNWVSFWMTVVSGSTCTCFDYSIRYLTLLINIDTINSTHQDLGRWKYFCRRLGLFIEDHIMFFIKKGSYFVVDSTFWRHFSPLLIKLFTLLRKRSSLNFTFTLEQNNCVFTLNLHPFWVNVVFLL